VLVLVRFTLQRFVSREVVLDSLVLGRLRKSGRVHRAGTAVPGKQAEYSHSKSGIEPLVEEPATVHGRASPTQRCQWAECCTCCTVR